MPNKRGRGSTEHKSPLLIRDYLAGVSWPDAEPDDSSDRRTKGDYLARIHRRVKLVIRENNRRYQYPRLHSFNTFLHHLLKLGLVERTGKTADGKLNPKLGFSKRVYWRLTEGSEARIEWNDPIGYLSLIYPGIRQPGNQPPPPGEAPAIPRRRRRRGVAPPAPTPAPAPAPAAPKVPPREEATNGKRKRKRRPTDITIPAETLAELESRRLALLAIARQAESSGMKPDDFANIETRVRALVDDVKKVMGKKVYLGDLPAFLDGLRTCMENLRKAGPGLSLARGKALQDCRARARLVAEELERRFTPQ